MSNVEVQNDIQQKDDEDINFRWLLDKFKNGKMEWEVFFPMMKFMISKDFSKSKELNFVLLEEMKQFKECETEIRILRHENKSLKDELQRKNDSQPISLSNLDIDKDSDTHMEIEIVENDLEDTSRLQNSGIVGFSSKSKNSNFENNIELKTEDLNLDENDFVTRIKIEELNPLSDVQVSKDVYVALIPLSESTLKHYLKDNYKTVNSNLNINSVHEAQRNHKCDQCEKSYSRLSHLIRHRRTAHEGLKINPRQYKCDKCEYASGYLSNLKKHINRVHIHEGNSMRSCNMCDKTFSSFKYLRRHVKRIHEGLKKNNKCNKCSNSFYSPSGLNRHIREVHEGLKNHKCNECNKRFNRPHDLKRHFETKNHIKNIQRGN